MWPITILPAANKPITGHGFTVWRRATITGSISWRSAANADSASKHRYASSTWSSPTHVRYTSVWHERHTRRGNRTVPGASIGRRCYWLATILHGRTSRWIAWGRGRSRRNMASDLKGVSQSLANQGSGCGAANTFILVWIVDTFGDDTYEGF